MTGTDHPCFRQLTSTARSSASEASARSSTLLAMVRLWIGALVQSKVAMKCRDGKPISAGVGFCVLLIAVLACNGDAAAQSRKLIIDADPGIDDAIAIILAIQHPGFEILGITTTFGNATLEQATTNALRIAELSGKPIPVYKGAGKPMLVPLEPPPDFVHGQDGLGNTHHPAPSARPQDKPAAQFLIDMAKAYPGQVTILAIGRLTNLAEALQRDPTLADDIREVVLMGGALHVPGNVSPVAEANVSGDPHAADLVFTAPWKVTMIGLDVTTKVRLSGDILSRVKLRNERYGEFLYSITRFYEDFHRQQNVDGGFYVHDPSAVVYLIEPGLFTLKEGPMRVVSEGIAIGQTIMAAYDYQFQLSPWKDQPMVKAAMGVDAERFQETIEFLLSGNQP